MVHPQQVTLTRDLVKVRRVTLVVSALLAITAVPACDGDTILIPAAPFGQLGEVQVEVRSVLPGEARNGHLTEILIWASNGPWLLTERVSYEGNLGAETLRSSKLNPGELAQEYGSLIQQLSETQGLRLFGGAVPQELDPECGGSLPATQVVFTIRDDRRDEVATWTRCAEGTLFTFEPGSAAPDPGASRVVTAGQLARFFTLGESSASTYSGTIPFAALQQGDDSGAREEAPRAFASGDGEVPEDFARFWEDHAGPTASLPRVDWGSELVLLVAVGLRREAGDVVRVRRILPLGQANGTRVEVIERVPGDFCSPASVSLYPFQIVILPADDVHVPIEFTQPQLERIPCGA